MEQRAFCGGVIGEELVKNTVVEMSTSGFERPKWVKKPSPRVGRVTYSISVSSEM
jgi:hypothetical protein